MSKSHATGWTSESPTPAQLKEFFAQIEKGKITKQRLQLLLRGKDEPQICVSELLTDWQTFYHEIFNLTCDFSGIRIPEHRPGFERLIVVAQGMTPEWLFQKCKEHFPARKYTDRSLDEVITSERTAQNGTYAIWIRGRVEADEELKNLSANNLKTKGIITQTIEERLVDEIKYFRDTSKHMDVNNITLCACSRYSDGSVPGVDWSDDEMGVDWYDPVDAHVDLRGRVVVS